MCAYATVAQVRLKSGLTSTEISDDNIQVLIKFSDSELENTTNQKYSNGTAITKESHKVYLPKRADDIVPNVIILNHYPVQSITEFLLQDSSGGTSSTLAVLSNANILAGNTKTADYDIEPDIGKIELTSKAFDYVPRKAIVSYTYGSAEIPYIVSELSANLAAQRALVQFLGGNYDKANSYSLPEQSYNKGDFYDRGKQMLEHLKQNTEDLFAQIGKKQRSQMEFTSGGYF